MAKSVSRLARRLALTRIITRQHDGVIGTVDSVEHRLRQLGFFSTAAVAKRVNEKHRPDQSAAHRRSGMLESRAQEIDSAAMPDKLSPQSRARKIKLLLFDVDGVLTDGKLFIFPTPAGVQRTVQEHAAEQEDRGGFAFLSQSLIEAKGFHAHDGTAISLLRLGSIRTGLITKRISETVALRARDLKLEYVYQGIQDKLTTFREILHKAGITAGEAAFIGDDVIDLPPMRHCGFAVAVANARAEVKREAHYVTPHGGGDGALRDAAEFILKAQGKWKRVVEEYIGERSSKSE